MINQANQDILEIYLFAFAKFYLSCYIEALEKENKMNFFEVIDAKLCEQGSIMENLRLYCLKLLRRKMTVKEIYDKYYKMKKVDWTEFMKEDMKQK